MDHAEWRRQESASLRVLSCVSSHLLGYTGKKPSLSCSLPAQIPMAGLAAPNSHTLCMSGHADHTERMDWSYMLTVALSSLKADSEVKAGPACLRLMKEVLPRKPERSEEKRGRLRSRGKGVTQRVASASTHGSLWSSQDLSPGSPRLVSCPSHTSPGSIPCRWHIHSQALLDDKCLKWTPADWEQGVNKECRCWFWERRQRQSKGVGNLSAGLTLTQVQTFPQQP